VLRGVSSFAAPGTLTPVTLAGRPERPTAGHCGDQLELLDERRFGDGMVHLRYRTRT